MTVQEIFSSLMKVIALYFIFYLSF